MICFMLLMKIKKENGVVNDKYGNNELIILILMIL